MYECSHCLANAARAVLGRNSQHLRQTQRATVAQVNRRLRSRQLLSTRPLPLDDDASVPFDAATKKLEISPVPRLHLELELKWLPDKIKFAERIRKLLYEEKDEPKALALLRFGSKGQDRTFSTVAWNHMIKYHLDAGHSARAFDLFNDMKKRAQAPDAITYLFLIKGTVVPVDAHKKPSSVQVRRVVHILDSMFASNSKVKPTLAHIEAAIRAVQSDLDKIWEILALLPEEGSCAPSARTYGVVLTALAGNMAQIKDDDPDIDKLKAAVMDRAKDLWSTAVQAIQSGKMSNDPRLVVNMADLLLRSPQLRDWDDILNLVDQVAQLPRQVPDLDSSERNIKHVPEALQLADTTPSPTNPFKLTLGASEQRGKDKKLQRHIKLDAGILNLVLRACQKLREPKAAQSYWKLVVDECAVKPDIRSLNTMLSICNLNRTSARAAELCKSMVDLKLQPTKYTFSTAMTACQRNWKSKASIKHAEEIVDVMSRLVVTPDVQVLHSYISLAMTSEDGPLIVHAFNSIDDSLVSVRSLLSVGSSHDRKWTPTDRAEYLTQALDFYRYLISTIHKMMARNWVPTDQHKLWHARRSDLAAFADKLSKKQGSSSGQELTDLRDSPASKTTSRPSSRLMTEARRRSTRPRPAVKRPSEHPKPELENAHYGGQMRRLNGSSIMDYGSVLSDLPTDQ